MVVWGDVVGLEWLAKCSKSRCVELRFYDMCFLMHSVSRVCVHGVLVGRFWIG